MKRREWAPRDTWPELRVVFLPLPWTWRLLPSFHADSLSMVSLRFLFVRVEWVAQDRVRDWFRENTHAVPRGVTVHTDWPRA